MRFRMKGLVLAAGLLVLAATVARAEVVAPDLSGKVEVGLSGTANLSKPNYQTVALRVAPYLDKNLQAGVDLSYAHTSGYTQYAVEGLLNYNLDSQSAGVPYAGVALGTAKATGSKSVTGYGAQAGVKYFLSKDVSIFTEINYRKYDKGLGDNTALLVGFNTYIG